jgi:hypothetical protein
MRDRLGNEVFGLARRDAVPDSDYPGMCIVEVDLTFDVSGAFDPYPDRMALEALTVCCVCGMPIEPENQAEFEACETLGVHVGECFQHMKREAARMPVMHMVDELDALPAELMREILP